MMAQPTPEQLGYVCVLGPGRMGAQIALEYALGGHNVACAVRSHARAAKRIEDWARTLEELELASPAQLTEAQDRIQLAAADSLPFSPDLIIESLPEDHALKVETLRPLAARFRSAIIASNTSSLSISTLGRTLGAGRRILGTHYLNPPLLMPLVEVIRGKDTQPDVLDDICATLQQLGKQPVVVKTEVPGFVWNRLQFALLREACSLVKHGIVEATMIDEVLRLGLARRWRATGLFGTVALGGVETFVKAAATIVPTLAGDSDLSRLKELTPPSLPNGFEQQRNALLAADLRNDRDDHAS